MKDKLSVYFTIQKTFYEGRTVYYLKEVYILDREGNAECYKCDNVNMTSRQASALGNKIIKMAKAGSSVKEITKEIGYLLYGDMKPPKNKSSERRISDNKKVVK